MNCPYCQKQMIKHLFQDGYELLCQCETGFSPTIILYCIKLQEIDYYHLPFYYKNNLYYFSSSMGPKEYSGEFEYSIINRHNDGKDIFNYSVFIPYNINYVEKAHSLMNLLPFL